MKHVESSLNLDLDLSLPCVLWPCTGMACVVAHRGGQTAQNPLLQGVISLLGQNSSVGGLACLVQGFQKNGLGDIVNSWVSTGQESARHTGSDEARPWRRFSEPTGG